MNYGAANRYDFDNPNKWVTIPSVPLLDEHEMTDQQGNPVTYVGPRELQQIANNNNRRVRETGDPATLILGHTSDDPRAEEKPAKGFAVNYQVKPFRRDPKTGQVIYAIHGDLKVRPKNAHLIEEYPRRSVELWWNKREIDPIALLGGTAPERDLSVVIRNARLNHVSLNQLGEQASTFTLKNGEVYAIDKEAGVIRFSRRGDSVVETYTLTQPIRLEAKHSKKWVSQEIKHLMKDKKYPQKRAVAAALNQAGMSNKRQADAKKNARIGTPKQYRHECSQDALPNQYEMDGDPERYGALDQLPGMDEETPTSIQNPNEPPDDDTSSDPLVAKVLQSRQFKDLTMKLDQILGLLEESMAPPDAGMPPGDMPPGEGGMPPPGPPPGAPMDDGMGAPPPGEEGDEPPLEDEESRTAHGERPVQFETTGMPGPNNTFVPGFKGSKKPFSRPRDTSMNHEDRIRMSRQQQEITNLQQKIGMMEAEKAVSELERVDGIVFGAHGTPDFQKYSRQSTVELLSRLRPEEFQAEVEMIRYCYARRTPDPAAPAMPGVARFARPAAPGEVEEEFVPENPEEGVAFADLMTTHRMSRKDASDYMKKNYRRQRYAPMANGQPVGTR